MPNEFYGGSTVLSPLSALTGFPIDQVSNLVAIFDISFVETLNFFIENVDRILKNDSQVQHSTSTTWSMKLEVQCVQLEVQCVREEDPCRVSADKMKSTYSTLSLKCSVIVKQNCFSKQNKTLVLLLGVQIET